jgi:hypothetical protein
MRKKALLAGAGSSFEGPWVNLESGEWLVEPSKDVRIELYESTKCWPQEDGKYHVTGPIRIHAIVSPDYDGDGVFLSIRQISEKQLILTGVDPA